MQNLATLAKMVEIWRDFVLPTFPFLDWSFPIAPSEDTRSAGTDGRGQFPSPVWVRGKKLINIDFQSLSPAMISLQGGVTV